MALMIAQAIKIRHPSSNKAGHDNTYPKQMHD